MNPDTSSTYEGQKFPITMSARPWEMPTLCAVAEAHQEEEISFQILQFIDPLDLLKKTTSVLCKFWGKEERPKICPASPSME